MANFLEAFNKLNDDFQNATNSPKQVSYLNLSETCRRFEASLREYLQFVSKEKIGLVIRKLKTGALLNSDDIELVKLWIVGDADYYTRMEQHYDAWVKEIAFLVEEINRCRASDPDLQTGFKIRAMLLDGIRVLNDISFFLEQKERVTNFNQATQNIDPEQRQFLIRLLEQKINSVDY